MLPHRGVLTLYLLTAVGLAIFNGLPLLLAHIFLNWLQQQPTNPKDRVGIFIDDWFRTYFMSPTSYVYALCALMMLCIACKSFFDLFNTYLATWLAQRLRMEAMKRVMRKLLALDQAFFDKQKIGDMVSRMVSDGDNLRKTVKIFLEFMQQPFMVVVLVSIAIYNNWLLFCLGAIGVPLVIFPLTRIIRAITRQTKRYQEKTANIAQAMVQNLSGMRIIHAYDAVEKEAENFNKLSESLFRTGQRRNWNRAMQRPLTELMLGVGMIAVMLFAGLKAGASDFDANSFLIFFAALALTFGPVRAMLSTLSELAEVLPSAERTFEILDIKPTIIDLPNAIVCPALKKQIVFENVSFDYGRGMVLNNLNLSIHCGEKIGIVGRTGVGKSTLLALLLRFYDPTSGRILMDGVDIKSVSLASLRAQMALVAQQSFLFHASVADNIRYGRLNATDDEVFAAARSAMIHDEIMQQPEGYQTLCGERGGELFSGGQRQRIAVARAILRNAPILLLDEATSALDASSERRVQDALDQLVVSRTSLIVAHRLSTLRHVDRILIFAEGGGIEAIGTHQELLRGSSGYAQLWQQQSVIT
ncbi:MAG: ABC transporter ATP-binding protein [Planctomycetota bacterium]